MENNNHNDESRFNKLYELLGDEVNSIYDTKGNDEIFNDNKIGDTSNTIDIPTETITEELFIEPTKITIPNKINKTDEHKFNDLVKPFDTTRGKEIKNKIKDNKQITFEDDIDTTFEKNNSIINIFSNHEFLAVIATLLLVFVTILAIKAIHFKKIIDNYDSYVSTEDDNIKVYEDSENKDIYKGGKASELVNCVTKPIDTNNLPASIKSIIDEITKYYQNNNSYFAFTYKDIFTGFTVSYNENGAIFAASTIKAPVNIYLYEMASEGKINLDDKLTYTQYYYNNGTGVLKNKAFDTTYTIRTLSEYAIRNSDNAAHNMLMDKYGKSNILNFWRTKGTNTIFTGSDNWGMITAHDATIYMEELYKFYLDNNEYGEELMNNFLNAKTKFITGKNNYKVANKSGWSGYSQHDASIVFSDNPYIVIALSNMGMNDNYMSHFNKVNDFAYSLHDAYWKYKIDKCSDIKLY